MKSVKVFNELWEKYDKWYDKYPVIAENELKLLRSIAGDFKRPALEVGVGTGFFARELSLDVGVDPSINMLKAARFKGIEVIRGVGEWLPFNSSCFETVFIIATLCFVDDPKKVLREVNRVLRNHGTLVTCIIPRDSSWDRWYKEVKRSPFYEVADFFTVEKAKKLLGESGFEVADAQGVLGFKPGEEPRPEKPSRELGDFGFVCIKALKVREAF
ncbi:MAG: class I SAM-dependent methyltransferase [Candidatus Verstraetearchaeota archaeon]|nr:class I SAM-dependent methyltransferase [Candidatus Verstraetearchaeota archaeon]